MLRPASLLPALSQAFDTPLWPSGSLLPAGACYRALRRLPGQDFHLLEERVFQDAPCAVLYSKERGSGAGILKPARFDVHYFHREKDLNSWAPLLKQLALTPR